MRRATSPLPQQEPMLNKVCSIREGVVDEATRLQSAKVRALHDWWLAARVGDMPRWRAFDVTEHVRLVPNLFVIEALAEGRFRAKLLGEEVIQLFGHNPTGRIVAAEDRNIYGHALDEYYWAIVRNRSCRTCTGTLAAYDRDYIRFESIDCPVADETGRVTAILGLIEALP